jgi:hypothetical protein
MVWEKLKIKGARMRFLRVFKNLVLEGLRLAGGLALG